ncbi:MAG TPA: type II toxin-antitoxin system VapB family antitoxin [Stellaceae bacterium]|jgi:antitoxin VapB|nr:type II toxin-antitoxin system VapB family antitoxin [Stellaceae bacterium]
MTLNIKSDEAHRLARKLADATGESKTAAVTEAMRERLARLKRGSRESRVGRILAIGRGCAAHLGEETRTLDHGEFLYNEQGLPRDC